MADKLIACTCGGQGVTIDAEPPQREVEWCKKHGCEPRRHYAVRCNECGKQTQPYTIKTPAWKEWNRLNKTRCKYKLFNAKQKAMIMRRLIRMLKDARDESPNDEVIKGYAEDLYDEILIAAEKGANDDGKADKK